MKECLCCFKNLTQVTGKRERLFCDNTCRSNYWQKAKRLEKKNFTAEEIVSILSKKAPIDKPREVKEEVMERENKKEMPKGMSASEQLEWRISNL